MKRSLSATKSLDARTCAAYGPRSIDTDARLNLFLLLTAMLSALAGVGRPVAARAAVEAAQVVAVAQAVVPVSQRVAVARPDGYVAPAPLVLDLRTVLSVTRPVAPERRRE